ncbi:MAG: hypothetical protein C5B59_12285 [Bacteroidetes bacterium]|nr:MAG: hypothetical protein C5B59_12285 [Bacteroidota bacterium]
MNTYLKNKPAWTQLLIFGGITFVLAFFVTAIGTLILASINHMSLSDLRNITPEDYSKPQYAPLTKGLLIVQFFGFFFLPSMIFAYFADPKPLKFAGLRKPDRAGFVFLGTLIILCSYVMVAWLSELNQEIVKNFLGKSAQQWIEKSESDVNATLQNILTMKNPIDLIISIFLVGVLAAVGEELFFRGILQRIFIQICKSPWLGIILTAAIFSAVHGQFLGFLPRMILGIILGALYWYSGSLIPAIVGHFVFNSIQVCLVYFKVWDVNQPSGMNEKMLPVAGIISIVAIVALMNYIRKRSLTTYDRVYGTGTDTNMRELDL